MSTRGRTIVFACSRRSRPPCVCDWGYGSSIDSSSRRTQNAIVSTRGAQPPLSLAALQGQDTSVTHWRRVTVQGVAEYDRELVHATRSQNGSPGVFLLTPVRPLDGSWGDTAIIVLRGYLYAADGRTVDFEKAREWTRYVSTRC